MKLQSEIRSDTPLVSIVTVVYNGKNYLSKALDSISAQSYPNIEHIVIDGESTDGTLDVIRKHESQIAFWKSEKDNGLADAMNKSIRHCHGKYILFLHADDLLMDNAVTDLVASLSNSKRNWAMGFYKYINSHGTVTREDKVRDFTFFDMILRNIVRHQATIVPLEVFSKINFESKFKYAMDYMFFIKVWEMFGPPQIVKKHLSYFRLDGKNLSSDFYASIKDEMKVRREYRTLKRERIKLPFDYFIYFLRVFKIFVYHSRTQHVE